VGRARRTGSFDRVFEQTVDLDRLRVHLQPSGLDAVEVEHVIDHAVEPLGILVDVARIHLGLFQRDVLVADHLAEA